MKDFWTILIKALMDYISKWLDPLDKSLAPRMGAALEEAAKDMPAPSFSVDAAPNELRDLIRKLVTDFVNAKFASRRIIRNMVLAVVTNMPDALLDAIWDSLFKAGALTAPMPVRGSMPPAEKQCNPVAVALAAELA